MLHRDILPFCTSSSTHAVITLLIAGVLCSVRLCNPSWIICVLVALSTVKMLSFSLEIVRWRWFFTMRFIVYAWWRQFFLVNQASTPHHNTEPTIRMQWNIFSSFWLVMAADLATVCIAFGCGLVREAISWFIEVWTSRNPRRYQDPYAVGVNYGWVVTSKTCHFQDAVVRT